MELMEKKSCSIVSMSHKRAPKGPRMEGGGGKGAGCLLLGHLLGRRLLDDLLGLEVCARGSKACERGEAGREREEGGQRGPPNSWPTHGFFAFTALALTGLSALGAACVAAGSVGGGAAGRVRGRGWARGARERCQRLLQTHDRRCRHWGCGRCLGGRGLLRHLGCSLGLRRGGAGGRVGGVRQLRC